MSDKKPRPLSEIQTQYQITAAKAGYAQYQIYHFTNDLKLLNETLRDLNFEAADAQRQAEEEAKAKAAEAPAPVTEASAAEVTNG
jgi:hypothetical protein